MVQTILSRIGGTIWNFVTTRLLQKGSLESSNIEINDASARSDVNSTETKLGRATRVAHDQLIGLPKSAWALAWLLLHKLFENCKVVIQGGGSRRLAAVQIAIILIILVFGGASVYIYSASSIDDAKIIVSGLTCRTINTFCPTTVFGKWSYSATGVDGSSWGGAMNIVQVSGNYQNAFKAVGSRNWKKGPEGNVTCSSDSWDSDTSAYLDEDIIYHYDLKFKPIKGFVRMSSQESSDRKRFKGEYYESVDGRLEQGEIIISREPETLCVSDVASSK